MTERKGEADGNSALPRQVMKDGREGGHCRQAGYRVSFV